MRNLQELTTEKYWKIRQEECVKQLARLTNSVTACNFIEAIPARYDDEQVVELLGKACNYAMQHLGCFVDASEMIREVLGNAN